MPEGPAGTKAWLREAGIRPRKAWGQSFLINARVAERIVAGWELRPGDSILEIGAGAGSLTLPLLATGARVLAVERDPRLADLLARRIDRERPGAAVRIVTADVLSLAPAEEIELFRRETGATGDAGASTPWALAGNLPYRFTTAILDWTIRHRTLFRRASFMVQREYGERLLAPPGSAAYGSLTVWMALFFHGTRELAVGPGNFWPIPKVESVVLRLEPHPCAPVEIPSEEIFSRVVRAAFGQRRKTVLRALSGGLGLDRLLVEGALEAAGLEGRRRAEEFGLEQFAALSRALAPVLPASASPRDRADRATGRARDG